MFDLANWQNPETLMLNVTNAALGLAVVYIIGYIIVDLVHDQVAEYLKKYLVKH
jgi:F0F1-type ATP synthase membrane subunit a